MNDSQLQQAIRQLFPWAHLSSVADVLVTAISRLDEPGVEIWEAFARNIRLRKVRRPGRSGGRPLHSRADTAARAGSPAQRQRAPRHGPAVHVRGGSHAARAGFHRQRAVPVPGSVRGAPQFGPARVQVSARVPDGSAARQWPTRLCAWGRRRRRDPHAKTISNLVSRDKQLYVNWREAWLREAFEHAHAWRMHRHAAQEQPEHAPHHLSAARDHLLSLQMCGALRWDIVMHMLDARNTSVRGRAGVPCRRPASRSW